MWSAAIFAAYGKALQGIRDKVYLQIHFGADYTSGEYGWTTDLALQGDALAREHYLTLEKRTGDCIGCGHCDGLCPFHVAQSRRMQEILAYFGAQQPPPPASPFFSRLRNTFSVRTFYDHSILRFVLP
mgnify:CR=1 FL=1